VDDHHRFRTQEVLGFLRHGSPAASRPSVSRPGPRAAALFELGRGHLLVHRPTDDPPSRGRRVRPVTLPAVELAVATHVGEHDDIDVTYGEVGAWVAGTLAVAGPVRETYLVGPRDTPEPSARRTEIGWPVFRVAAH